MSTIHREHLLPVMFAAVFGVIAIVSLLLPWVYVGGTENKELDAFRLRRFAAEALGVALLETAFNFLILFGALMVVGAVLMLIGFDVGPYIIYSGAILNIIFTILALTVSSLLPSVSPRIGVWVCLIAGIAGLISPKLHLKKT